METPIIPILLTGGSGTRLWPVSRDAMPKQFLPLFGEKSTFQQTLNRVSNPNLFSTPIVLTSESFRFFARQQAQEEGVSPTIVLEPVRRDSGPAILAGAFLAARQNPKALVLVLAADQLIPDTELFHEACITGRRAAQDGSIVLFGIRPTEPKTSYGYIHQGDVLNAPDVFVVSKFVEKPDRETAQRYMESGFLWNSGNFLFRVDVFLQEVARYEPQMFKEVEQAVAHAESDLGFTRLEPTAFARAPQKSVDYAVMERTSKAAVVEGRFRWSDIGSWEGMYQSVDKDPAGNAVRGAAVLLDTENSLVHAERVTALLGVKDIVVVTTQDAVMVVSRDRAEDVKKLVGALHDAGHKEAREHSRVYRPWGYFESMDTGDRFQVKRIVVLPGEMLSLQKHLHRSEHWVVVRGVAEVTVNEEKKLLHENESIYVPMGALHRLGNPGKIQLELVEVQTGSYLGEDDITRLDDIYKRGS